MIKGYKGFNKDLQCDPTGNAPFQYEIGKEYEEDTAKCCSQGFHFCENPLDVLHYYSPAKGSRYCEVEGDGDISKDIGDSKVAVTKIKIGAELSLSSLIKSGVEFVFKKVKWGKSPAASTGDGSTAASSGNYSTAASTGDGSTATSNGNYSTAASSGNYSTAASTGDGSTAASSGDGSTAASSGNYSAAASTGDYSTAASSGNYSTAASSGNGSTAASNGYGSAAASSGDRSTAASSGDRSTAEAVGKEAVAISLGIDGTAKAGLGAWITLAEWAMDKDKNFYRKWIKSRKVDGESIKPNVLYKLKNGRFVEA